MELRSQSLLSDLRLLPRSFWILFAGTFINRFGTFVWPFLTIYLTRQGFTAAQAGIAISTLGVGAIVGATLGGWLADHIGRRHTIVLGTFGAASCVMLLYYAHGFPAILASAWLLGLTSGAYQPAASALLADIVPHELRVRAYATSRLAANAGFACGVAIGGLLATHSTLLLFVGDAFTTIVYGFIALIWLPHGLRSQTRNAPWTDAFVHLSRDRNFHALWQACLLSAIVFTQCGTTYSLHILNLGLHYEVFGYHLGTESIYGLLLGWNGALVVVAELPLTSLTLRFDTRRVMALGYVLTGIGFALNAWAQSFWAFFAAMTIFTFGEMISAPTTSAFVARIAPDRLRGRYMGALGSAGHVANIFGPPLSFLVFKHYPLWLWFGCGILGLLAAATTLGLTPQAKDPVPADSDLQLQN